MWEVFFSFFFATKIQIWLPKSGLCMVGRVLTSHSWQLPRNSLPCALGRLEYVVGFIAYTQPHLLLSKSHKWDELRRGSLSGHWSFICHYLAVSNSELLWWLNFILNMTWPFLQCYSMHLGCFEQRTGQCGRIWMDLICSVVQVVQFDMSINSWYSADYMLH